MRKCNNCHQNISRARLRWVPSATLCRNCQEALERAGVSVRYRPPATAIAVLSEDDDSTRVIEEGWHQGRFVV